MIMTCTIINLERPLGVHNVNEHTQTRNHNHVTSQCQITVYTAKGNCNYGGNDLERGGRRLSDRPLVVVTRYVP